jgi:glutaredoxin 1
MITIYAKNNCKWCTLAKDLAESRGLSCDYRNVDDNFQFLLELSSLKPDVKTLPQIWWNDKHVGGYTDFAAEIENTMGDYGNGQI